MAERVTREHIFERCKAKPGEKTLLEAQREYMETPEVKWERVVAEGKPRVTFVSGLSGEGKTSLVDHYLSQVKKNREVLVLSGRCYDRESVPFAQSCELMRKCIDGYEGRGRLVSKSAALHHLGFLELQSSNDVEAARVLMKAKELIREYWFYGEFPIRTYPWLIEALVGTGWHEQVPPGKLRDARRLIFPTRFFAWR